MLKQNFIKIGFLLLLAPFACAQEALLLGWLEFVKILPEQLHLEAKLDTGADLSSLHAEKIEAHTVHSKVWIKFSFREIGSGNSYTFDKPLLRYVRVKKRFGEMQNKRPSYFVRPVVALTLCLGGKAKVVEVNLVNRSHFKYKLLVGLKTMRQFSVMIDPLKTHITLANCS